MKKQLGLLLPILLLVAACGQSPTAKISDPAPAVNPASTPAAPAPVAPAPAPKLLAGALPDARNIPPDRRPAIEQRILQVLEKPTKVDLGNSPSKGPRNAPLTLVEFSDFQCPFCSRARELIVKPLFDKYPGKIRLVYKNFPLQQHQFAYDAAKAAWAAGQQGKFFEYHDQLFDRQENLGEATFSDIARQLKLDIARFDRDRKSPAADAAVKQDREQGGAVPVSGTPTFILNGVVFQADIPLDVVDLIVEILKEKKGLKV
ncbi:DsbA family protein [Anthocerotibacter panamensis]|uniref:DsbA family protein n=1 Tax=Anthocerotibacter panamensis TaxID=2857077 RepID=UPI001C4046AE|nr:thioredoxin domain-containing protein [Anthocerotibacter panamensis]